MSPSEFLSCYETATGSQDLEGTLNLIAEDAVFLFSNGTTHLGKPAIRQALAANFATIKDEIYRLSDVHWLATSDNIAACVYNFNWSGIIDGEPACGHGRGTSVIRKDKNEWLVAHEHLSAGKI
jgi:uncharacterized protein (TIGR02246 family)